MDNDDTATRLNTPRIYRDAWQLTVGLAHFDVDELRTQVAAPTFGAAIAALAPLQECEKKLLREYFCPQYWPLALSSLIYSPLDLRVCGVIAALRFRAARSDNPLYDRVRA